MKRIFVRGLIAISPIAIVILFLVWAFQSLDALFAPIVRTFVPAKYYFSGLGFFIAILFILAVGILLQMWFVNRIHNWFVEKIVKKIPLIKTLYKAISDMMGFFQKQKTMGQSVVWITFGGQKALGLITNNSLKNLNLKDDGFVSVYIPFSYQIGGFTFVCKKTQVEVIPEMSVEEAMRLSITAYAISEDPAPSTSN